MNKWFTLLATIFSILMFSGCIPTEDPNGTSGGSGSGGGFEGTWILDCTPGLNNSHPYISYAAGEANYTFNADGTFSGYITYYSDAGCAPGTSVQSGGASGTYTIGAQKILTTGETVNELDVAYTVAGMDTTDYYIYYVSGDMLYMSDAASSAATRSETIPNYYYMRLPEQYVQ